MDEKPKLNFEPVDDVIERIDLVEKESPERESSERDTPPPLKAASEFPRVQDPEFPDLGERYEVLEEIGFGGMGKVYKVHDKILEQTFAIKLLRKELSLDQGAIKRFQQEVKAASELTHANLAAVYGHGTINDGTPYMVMDLIDGISLAERIKRGGKLDVENATEMFQQIVGALIHAHAKGIIHRDLKPSNIILSKNASGESVARVVDFGIAKVLTQPGSETITGLTQTGDIFGSPLYMSPEQCQGEPLDVRSDVYAMGCVMFEALTGHPPFSENNNFKVMMKHVSEPAPVIEADYISLELKSIVAKCLEKDPVLRYQKAEDLLEDLDRVHKRQPLKYADTGPVKQALKAYKSSVSQLKKKNKTPKQWVATILFALVAMVTVVPATLWATRPLPATVDAVSPFLQGTNPQDQIPPDYSDLPHTEGPPPIFVQQKPTVAKPQSPPPAVMTSKVKAVELSPSTLSTDEKVQLRELVYRVSGTEPLTINPILAMGPKVLPDLFEGMSSADQGYARNCSLAINGFGQKALPQLLTIFENGSNKWIGQSIESMGDPGLLAIVPYLSDPDPAERAKAAGVISNALKHRVASEDAGVWDGFGGDKQRTALNIEISGRQLDQICSMLRWMMLNDANPVVRLDAAEALTSAADTADYSNALLYSMLNDESSNVRIAAAKTFLVQANKAGTIRSNAHEIGYFIQNEPDMRSRKQLIETLRRVAPSEACMVPYLRGAYHAGNDDIKREVLISITNLGEQGQDALPEIADALNGGNHLQFYALTALQKIGPRGAEIISKVKALLSNAKYDHEKRQIEMTLTELVNAKIRYEARNNDLSRQSTWAEIQKFDTPFVTPPPTNATTTPHGYSRAMQKIENRIRLNNRNFSNGSEFSGIYQNRNPNNKYGY